MLIRPTAPILRPYQADCLASLAEAVVAGRSSLGVMPTGSGKSLVIAGLMAGLAETGRRSLMLTHVRELVEQDATAFQRFAPGVDYGVFCRGLGRFELDSPIVFAQTQSLHARKHLLTAPFDVVIVDEAHLIPFSGEGRYVSLIRLLREMRLNMPFIGLTATPYRLRGGWLYQGEDAWFEDIAYEVSVLELIEQGYLAPLTGRKPSAANINTDGLRIERGDYRERDLVELVDDDALNRRMVGEIVRCGTDRRAWLVFAVGIDHAHVLQQLLQERGIRAGVVLGGTPKTERDTAIADFRSGRLRALINVNALTTGFDARDRPAGGGAADGEHVAARADARSRHADRRRQAGLPGARLRRQRPAARAHHRAARHHQQPAGRGCRRVAREGLSALRQLPGTRRPELRALRVRVRHAGAPTRLELRGSRSAVRSAGAGRGGHLSPHHKPGRPASLRITYRLPDRWLSEWLCLFHPGYAGEKARAEWLTRGGSRVPTNINEAVRLAPALRRPSAVTINETNGFQVPIPVWE